MPTVRRCESSLTPKTDFGLCEMSQIHFAAILTAQFRQHCIKVGIEPFRQCARIIIPVTPTVTEHSIGAHFFITLPIIANSIEHIFKRVPLFVKTQRFNCHKRIDYIRKTDTHKCIIAVPCSAVCIIIFSLNNHRITTKKSAMGQHFPIFDRLLSKFLFFL